MQDANLYDQNADADAHADTVGLVRALAQQLVLIPDMDDHSGHGGHDAHGGHGSHGGDTEGHVCASSMIFTWDTQDMCIVFHWWHISGLVSLVVSLIAVVALSAGYEFLRYRIRMLDRAVSVNNKDIDRRFRSIAYAVQVGYSFFLMLVFMTYNGWAILAVVAGSGLGFYLWGDRASRELNCH